MTRFHKSLKQRIIVLTLIMLVGIIAIIHSTVYVASKKLIDREIAKYAQSIAVAIACHVTRDIETYKAFITFVDDYKASKGYGPLDPMREPMPLEHLKNSEHFEYYQEIQKHFEHIREHSHIKYIYTERELRGHFIEYILEGEPIGSPFHSLPGAAEEFSAAHHEAYETMKPSSFGLAYYEGWGYLIGTYAPIVDDDGVFLGLVGVDVCGGEFQRHLNG
jgi:hypothetical protein